MTERKAVYVAGATGCTGAHIVRSLMARDAGERIKVSYHRTRPFVKDRRLSYQRADLRRFEDCRSCVAGSEAVVLAAGNVTGAASAAATQARQVADNVTMNMNLLRACAEAGVRRVILVGSATAYQESASALKEEDLGEALSFLAYRCRNGDRHTPGYQHFWGFCQVRPEGLARDPGLDP